VSLSRRELFAAGIALPGIQVTRRSGRAAPGTPFADHQWAVPDWFADQAWIEEHRADSAFRIVALTSPEEFEAGHIADAVQIDWPDLALTDSAEATIGIWRAHVEELLTGLGIIPASSVTIYDGGTFYAARLWWVLDQLGHGDKRILDGGLAAWTGATETGPAEAQLAFEPYAGGAPELELARLNDVIEAVERKSSVLVDARTSAEFAKGHIPGAVNIPFLENAVPDSGGRWKSPGELRAMYESAGVRADDTVIPYCSTGVRSAVTWFTLRALGYEHVRLYSASFAEWSSDPTRPIET
jgi:thiosulfate/3-mercaptopyruvate sulfurtransferase